MLLLLLVVISQYNTFNAKKKFTHQNLINNYFRVNKEVLEDLNDQDKLIFRDTILNTIHNAATTDHNADKSEKKDSSVKEAIIIKRKKSVTFAF